MTRTVDAGTQAQAEAPQNKPFYLLELYLGSGTQYFTSTDREVLWNGNTYQVFPFGLSKVIRSSVSLADKVTITSSNVNRDFAALLLSEQFRGRSIVIRRAYWATEYTVSAPLEVFTGLIDDIQGREDKENATIILAATADLVYWKRPIPGRIYQATCAWVFKGGECQYAGAESTCNHTWERCGELLNTARYGGFRHLPQLETKEIWWGRAGAFRID